MPILRRVAVRFARRLPEHVEVDELMAAGAVGLVLAVRQHVGKPREELERLAVRRVRGAILDHLRDVDHLTRRQRAAVGALQKAKDSLERAGARADLKAVASSMGVSAARAQKIQDGVAAVQVTDLPPADQLADTSEDPLAVVVAEQEHRRVVEALEALPERLQTLLSLYYYEELTYHEIGEVLRISRSRICQLHTQAIDLLKRQLTIRAA